ncbi:unnamed protein product [Bathycoccus prasinos]
MALRTSGSFYQEEEEDLRGKLFKVFGESKALETKYYRRAAKHTALLRMLKSIVLRQPDFYKKSQENMKGFIACNNCILDFNRGVSVPFDPKFYFTYFDILGDCFGLGNFAGHCTAKEIQDATWPKPPGTGNLTVGGNTATWQTQDFTGTPSGYCASPGQFNPVWYDGFGQGSTADTTKPNFLVESTSVSGKYAWDLQQDAGA